MQSKHDLGTLYYHIAEGTPGQVLDVFGSTVEFVATAARYGYTLGTPEQNAAVGIQTPKFAGEG